MIKIVFHAKFERKIAFFLHLLVLTIVTSCFCVQANEPRKDQELKFNSVEFKEAHIRPFLKDTLSLLLHKEFILDISDNETITLSCPFKISPDALLFAVLENLRVRNFKVNVDRNVITISGPKRSGHDESNFINREGSLASLAIQVRKKDRRETELHIKHFLSRNGRIAEYAPENFLVVSDLGYNLSRVRAYLDASSHRCQAGGCGGFWD